MNSPKKLFGFAIVVIFAILGFSGLVSAASDHGWDLETADQAFQTWIITDTESGQQATLTVDSLGNFTGSGWVGTAPGAGDYNIYITNGRMSGTSMTFQVSASYSGGQGTISGTGTGTLNASFPSATSASGTYSGTISDPLGDRNFSSPWMATRVGGDGGGGGLVFPDLTVLIYRIAPGVSLIVIIVAVVAIVVAILPLPRNGVRLGTKRAAAPPRGKLKTGAPASMVQHLDSIQKIPPGARPLPQPRLHPGKFEPTDVLQKVPCPYCGTIVISAFGKWYCPNPKCKWNKGEV